MTRLIRSRAGLCAVLLAGLGAAPATGPAVTRIRSVIPAGGELLEMQLGDVDGDGLRDLFLAVRLEDGSRRLHIHRLRADGSYPPRPDHDLEVKVDIVCWGIGEFRPEDPGDELLLLTRQGAYTLSPRRESYGGNIEKLIGANLLLDLPTDRALPVWEAIADVDGDGRDDVALATSEGFLLVDTAPLRGPDGKPQLDSRGRPQFVEFGRVPLRPTGGRAPAYERSFLLFSPTFSSQPLADLFVPDEDPGAIDPPPALFAEDSLPVPVLVDGDGDGLLDLLYHQGGLLYWHRQLPAGAPGGPRFQPQPDRVASMGDGDMELRRLEPAVVGGGPAADLLVTRSVSGASVGGGDWQFVLFHDYFARARAAAPDAQFTVDTLTGKAYFRDFDGDGRLDVGISAWGLSISAIGTAIAGGSVDIKHTVTLYMGGRDGFSRRADVRYERNYSADDFTAFSDVPPFPGDMNGDGTVDLLESDPKGVLEIRPLRMVGGAPKFDAKPGTTIVVDALQSRVDAFDLNADGVADLLIAPLLSSTLELYVSKL